jgi:hypothetical protein
MVMDDNREAVFIYLVIAQGNLSHIFCSLW